MLTLIKRPRTSLRNGKKPRQWKFGHLELVLHCNTCCANTTKYATASSTLKTRNGLAKSEPRPAARRIATSRSCQNCVIGITSVVLQVLFVQQNQRVKNVGSIAFHRCPHTP